MIKPDQIPKEVVAAIQICTGMSDAAARGLAIIMLEQWPGMQTDCERRVSEKWIGVREFPVLILPLPQDAGDE